MLVLCTKTLTNLLLSPPEEQKLFSLALENTLTCWAGLWKAVGPCKCSAGVYSSEVSLKVGNRMAMK